MSKVSCSNRERVLDLVSKLYLDETLAKLYEEQRAIVHQLIRQEKEKLLSQLGSPIPSPFKHWRKV